MFDGSYELKRTDMGVSRKLFFIMYEKRHMGVSVVVGSKKCELYFFKT